MKSDKDPLCAYAQLCIVSFCVTMRVKATTVHNNVNATTMNLLNYTLCAIKACLLFQPNHYLHKL